MKNHLTTALSYYGLKESFGMVHNEVIINFFKEIGHDWVSTDETAWCAAFVNYVLKVNNLPYTGKLNARSFLDIGEDVFEPRLGDIVVFWRDKIDSWKGHVGFFINQDEDYIYCLGGNQNNQVCIKPYPKTKLLKYRRV